MARHDGASCHAMARRPQIVRNGHEWQSASQYRYAETMLASLAASADSGTAGPSADGVGAADLEALHDGARGFERLYMVGDNPLTDIRGALDAGPRWSSLLVGTGMWQPGDDTGGATAVVDDVGAAVDWILEQHPPHP